MYRRILPLVVLSIALIMSCGPSDNDNKINELLNEDTITDDVVIDTETIENIVQNISSPVEMAALIKGIGLPFSKKYLCSTNNVDACNTNFKKALALGFYGADLGYLNIYNQTTQIISYIAAISKLSEGIKVGQFFDFATLKRLASNNENLDSLMYISVNSFNKMDNHLRENNRGNLSILIVSGVWLEGMHFAAQVYQEKPNKDIASRIGEQKIILNELLPVLNAYIADPDVADLIKDFNEINDAFNEIEIIYEVGEPERIERDGRLVIVQNQRSIVEITEEQLTNIIDIVERVRNKRSQELE